ncbi:hypothetical protein F5882DRAFT_525468 [Hyaloscypha sp. PMI_1271]|nr:hypothetical protein F5882DRAFT_525468 [Hyaloscypha sp. PMI_1271]
MDPVSIPALCLTCANVLLSLYQYLDAIKDAPRHIEDLTTELSIFNFVLTRLKGLIESRQESHQELLRKWADESKVVFSGCRDTLGKIEALVVKSKIKTKDYSIKGQVTKCVKWQWKKEDVLELRVALERYKASIKFDVAESRQLDNVAEIMERLHQNVLQLRDNRKFAKEILEVMKEGHPNFEHPDVNISYNVPVTTRTSATQTSKIQTAGSTSDYPTCLRTYSSGNLFVDFAFAKVEGRERWTVHVDSASPQSGTWKTRPDGVVVNFRFKAAADAESFFDLLGKVKAEVEHSWNMHVKTFVNADTKYDGNAVDMTILAANEEYKWGNYVRLYRDSNLGSLHYNQH